MARIGIYQRQLNPTVQSGGSAGDNAMVRGQQDMANAIGKTADVLGQIAIREQQSFDRRYITSTTQSMNESIFSEMSNLKKTQDISNPKINKMFQESLAALKQQAIEEAQSNGISRLAMQELDSELSTLNAKYALTMRMESEKASQDQMYQIIDSKKGEYIETASFSPSLPLIGATFDDATNFVNKFANEMGSQETEAKKREIFTDVTEATFNTMMATQNLAGMDALLSYKHNGKALSTLVDPVKFGSMKYQAEKIRTYMNKPQATGSEKFDPLKSEGNARQYMNDIIVQIENGTASPKDRDTFMAAYRLLHFPHKRPDPTGGGYLRIEKETPDPRYRRAMEKLGGQTEPEIEKVSLSSRDQLDPIREGQMTMMDLASKVSGAGVFEYKGEKMLPFTQQNDITEYRQTLDGYFKDIVRLAADEEGRLAESYRQELKETFEVIPRLLDLDGAAMKSRLTGIDNTLYRIEGDMIAVINEPLEYSSKDIGYAKRTRQRIHSIRSHIGSVKPPQMTKEEKKEMGDTVIHNGHRFVKKGTNK